MSDIVIVELADGSKVIGKHILPNVIEEAKISIIHRPLEGTFLHIGADLPIITSCVIAMLEEVGNFNAQGKSLLREIKISVEKNAEFSSKRN